MEIVRVMPEASELDQVEVTLLLLLAHSFERTITEAVTEKVTTLIPAHLPAGLRRSLLRRAY